MEHESELGPLVFKRSMYVLEEKRRAEETCRLLEAKDYDKFGEILYASHAGLKDKYEVSCEELDIMVEAASKIEGVLGARMMGRGFDGRTLNLVETDYVD